MCDVADDETTEPVEDVVIDLAVKEGSERPKLPNLKNNDQIIQKNDRIYQFNLRIMKHQPEIELVEVETLGNADRGGFGSTGKE